MKQLTHYSIRAINIIEVFDQSSGKTPVNISYMRCHIREEYICAYFVVVMQQLGSTICE